jgi:hypothetical protein
VAVTCSSFGRNLRGAHHGAIMQVNRGNRDHPPIPSTFKTVQPTLAR